MPSCVSVATSDSSSTGRRSGELTPSSSNDVSVASVDVVVSARASDGNDVRIAVLGPLVDGTRAVLAADGYASRARSAEVSLLVAQPGEHLVVVGSYNLATDDDLRPGRHLGPMAAASRDRRARDAQGLAPSSATPSASVQMMLGDMLVDRDFDVEVELWASPPMQPWNATKIATSEASGTQVNAIAPASVHPATTSAWSSTSPGDRILDTGVTTRFAPAGNAFARTRRDPLRRHREPPHLRRRRHTTKASQTCVLRSETRAPRPRPHGGPRRPPRPRLATA